MRCWGDLNTYKERVAGGHPAYVYRIRVFAGPETSVLYFIPDLLETDSGVAILRVRLW